MRLLECSEGYVFWEFPTEVTLWKLVNHFIKLLKLCVNLETVF